MIEVEIKAKINNVDEIKSKINNLNIKKFKEELQEDLYFQSPIVDFAKTDEALRIRKTVENNIANIFITYKGPKIDSESKTREEIEMDIEDSEKASKILKRIGFTPVRCVKKRREYYQYEECILSLDFVEGLEPYMEIETVLEDDSQYKNSQKKIFEIFKKLGIEDGFERDSYLELLENKK
ncbi:class IV adenylate cyclase [Methanobrevibacter sp. DSM 116169]|uniref:class IV adenylate cyclase n=1 Tax=Methanobrevibacter sp. DSM 116169 TaxID=3242727 RepID=UPI0038FCCB99